MNRLNIVECIQTLKTNWEPKKKAELARIDGSGQRRDLVQTKLEDVKKKIRRELSEEW